MQLFTSLYTHNKSLSPSSWSPLHYPFLHHRILHTWDDPGCVRRCTDLRSLVWVWLYVCAPVCVYVCTCVHVWACMHTCMCTCGCIRVSAQHMSNTIIPGLHYIVPSFITGHYTHEMIQDVLGGTQISVHLCGYQRSTLWRCNCVHYTSSEWEMHTMRTHVYCSRFVHIVGGISDYLCITCFVLKGVWSVHY